MNSLFDLRGKVALITGASSGLGRHFAGVLSRAGARVGLAARRVDALETAAAELSAGGAVTGIARLDLNDEESITSAIATIEQLLGPIDILVNNAGVCITKPVLEQTARDWDEVLDVNLRGAFLMSTHVARRMRELKRGGSIINIQSILSYRQAGHIAPYAASKAALNQLTKSMALELARFNIRVNGIAPGYFLTDINRDFFATEAGAAMVKRIPQRRLGRFEDLDGPLLLLASDASRYMTGSTIVVDGGHLCSNL
ncbi:MAG: glucose 1-dehydrogenase [Gammaproteobacteria bacterium]|nr:2-deoxy-D-gluconate 3-dehydrogenase [Gammaproteobacteria bacterium]